MAEGKVTSIRGHEAGVLSRGFICPKGAALRDLHEDPDRDETAGAAVRSTPQNGSLEGDRWNELARDALGLLPAAA